MLLNRLAEYINANAPMTNIPELINLHHNNPLGLHPIVIPIFLLLLAIAMHVCFHLIRSKDRVALYPTLYTLVALSVVATYYYCFSSDLPLFEDWQLEKKEISIGWFCQRAIVGTGLAMLGEVLLAYIVYSLLSAIMLCVARISDSMGIDENQWTEWRYVIFLMLLGASIAGIADEFAPITGIWIMIVYQLIMLLMIVVKLCLDYSRSHKFWRCLLTALAFFISIEAVTMLTIECIEGYIYVFLPVVAILSSVDFHYGRKSKNA